MKRSVLLQSVQSAEIRAVRTAGLLDDLAIASADMEQIPSFRAQLESGEMMPVGSVEFVSEAMSVAGIEPPQPPGFPASLQSWLHRTVARTSVGKLASLTARTFVKPVATKVFNGFVFDPADDAALDEHDREQLALLRRLDPATEVWTSPVVSFTSEWRYYVCGGRVIGEARYDPDGADDAPAPERAQVDAAIAAYGALAPYSLDMGVLASGETALVEIHDAWALGLYAHALTPRVYYRMLRDWWDFHLAQQVQPV
ncbi:ATP-grasp domain-containing protein [Ramlibacter sp. AN1133]|uniref:ATP-grasp domain-containing protein n=1 Tax=Ramlibacter sp. AN1133 TaxID=3133429 RepID=UPI0030C4D75F